MLPVSRLRAHRSRQGGSRTYRLVSSIRLPWAIGLATFLALALATALLVGRTGESTLRVPQVVLDYQEQIARDAAQSVRRSLNEGVTDLDELARVLSVTRATDLPALNAALREFARAHGRYTTVFATDARGAVLARAGPAPRPGSARQPLTGRPGMREVPRPSGGTPLIAQFAPVTATGSRVKALIGHYDSGYMRFALDVSRPGYAWVVNRKGQTVGARGAIARLGSLPRPNLRQAAGRAVFNLSGAQSAGGSLDAQEVVGFAPVSGSGPAGRLGWGVVTTRSVSSFSLPQTEARRHGLMTGVVLAVLALLIFGWLYVIVIAPLFRVQREAERLARGDLSKSVEVVRYDEIGLIARGLERLRITLIRKQVRSAPERTSSNGRSTKPGEKVL